MYIFLSPIKPQVALPSRYLFFFFQGPQRIEHDHPYWNRWLTEGLLYIKKIPSVLYITLGNGLFILVVQHIFVDHVPYMRLRIKDANSNMIRALFSRSWECKVKGLASHCQMCLVPCALLSTFQPACFSLLPPGCQTGTDFRSLYFQLPLLGTLPRVGAWLVSSHHLYLSIWAVSPQTFLPLSPK